MGTDAGLGGLVDLDRYPVGDLTGAVARSVIAGARAQLAATGAAELPGFVNPRGVAALVADAESLAARAHHSGGEGTAYLEFPDFDLPKDHPRLQFAPYAVGAVGYDVIPRSSPLRLLYEWDLLLGLIAAILDRGPLYRYGDPFGALNLAVMAEGDELQWHFDQTDFVVSLAVQSAERGGDFEVAPRIRNAGDECYPAVARVLAGDRRRGGDPAHDTGDPPHLRGPSLPAPRLARRGCGPAPRRAAGLRHEGGDHGERSAADGPLRPDRPVHRSPVTWPPG